MPSRSPPIRYRESGCPAWWSTDRSSMADKPRLRCRSVATRTYTAVPATCYRRRSLEFPPQQEVSYGSDQNPRQIFGQTCLTRLLRPELTQLRLTIGQAGLRVDDLPGSAYRLENRGGADGDVREQRAPLRRRSAAGSSRIRYTSRPAAAAIISNISGIEINHITGIIVSQSTA